MMSLYGRIMILPAALLALLSPPGYAVSTNLARVCVDVTSAVRGSTAAPRQGISVGTTTAGPFFQLGFPGAERAHLDTLMVRSNLVIFSTDVDVVISGTPYADEDLIAFAPGTGTYSLYFDGSAAGLPAAADLDAACFQYGTTNLLFSVDKTITLAGAGVVRHNDVIRYAAGVFTKFLDGSTQLGLPVAADLDALYHDGTNVLYSLNITATVGSVTGRDDQAFSYNTTSLVTSLLSGFGLEARADLTSLDFPLDRDGDGLTDYEELSGVDEPGTTMTGANAPLSPNGYLSNPLLADTDGDGYSDAEEAVAGTNPGNLSDYLRCVAMVDAGVGRVVSWASVPGRRYDVEAATQLSQFTNIVATNVTALLSTTSVTNPSAAAATFYRLRVRP